MKSRFATGLLAAALVFVPASAAVAGPTTTPSRSVSASGTTPSVDAPRGTVLS